MKKRFYSISYKLLLPLVAGTTIPMLIYCLFFYFDMRRSSENAYVTQARQTWPKTAKIRPPASRKSKIAASTTAAAG